jgi:hypothetical protein
MSVSRVYQSQKRRIRVKQEKKIFSAGLVLVILALLIFSVPPVTGKPEMEKHPELTEQEMLIACSDCHKDVSPELEEEWYTSVHGIAMVKCYQCHGTFESFKVTPSRADCAVCHADMLEKCQKDKQCWECHIPHSFKAEK